MLAMRGKKREGKKVKMGFTGIWQPVKKKTFL